MSRPLSEDDPDSLSTMRVTRERLKEAWPALVMPLHDALKRERERNRLRRNIDFMELIDQHVQPGRYIIGSRLPQPRDFDILDPNESADATDLHSCVRIRGEFIHIIDLLNSQEYQEHMVREYYLSQVQSSC